MTLVYAANCSKAVCWGVKWYILWQLKLFLNEFVQISLIWVLSTIAMFQSISSSNNREVDIEIYTPKADYYEIPIYLT